MLTVLVEEGRGGGQRTMGEQFEVRLLGKRSAVRLGRFG
jgi:hypothetical protein